MPKNHRVTFVTAGCFLPGPKAAACWLAPAPDPAACALLLLAFPLLLLASGSTLHTCSFSCVTVTCTSSCQELPGYVPHQ